MKLSRKNLAVSVISIILIGLVFYLPNNIHFKALCGDDDALVKIGFKLIQTENKDDQKKGYKLLLKASENGNVDAICLVGACKIYGYGVDQDNIGGYKDLKNAYELKNQLTEGLRLSYHLGVCYLYGKGTFQNVDKAIDLFKEESKKGDKLAVRSLAITYGLLAFGVCEKKEKEESVFFPDFYYTLDYRGNESYQETKTQWALSEKQKQQISYKIKAVAYSMVYSQKETDFDLKQSVESEIKNIPVSIRGNCSETTFELTPARSRRAEIIAKEFQQSMKTD